ncbi:protease inhibitor I42 family protein [Pedobacter sp. ISL-68]|uniref:protease inhibitor I42 family protein n=1 Tax=unclassified Pedobacter TaxID=2628915 RepID=UPI001BE9D83C|nr:MULTISPECIES: protease inhibitor I42 family protein [unclassified Pedobacter]MBT2560650.1 protease inhibitor I42 family protein [Pedobacter sp. ISL-64]MBT2590029.1 protease inhibitor I42 family protein [Pedobacter sp. ISL-68]
MYKSKSRLSYTFIFLASFIIVSCASQLIPKGAFVVDRDKPFHVEIPSNLGRGYQWKLADTVNYKVLSHDSKPNIDKSQATDIELFEITTSKKKGSHQIVFYYLRPFEKNIDTANAEKFVKIIFVKK